MRLCRRHAMAGSNSSSPLNTIPKCAFRQDLRRALDALNGLTVASKTDARSRRRQPERPRTNVTPMADLVDTIRKEIDARLEELRPLAREASDLKRALDALKGVPAAPTADGHARRHRSGQRASPRPSRAARGDIRALVIEYVAAN